MRTVGVVLVILLAVVVALASGILTPSSNVQNLPAEQASVVRDYVYTSTLVASYPAWVSAPATNVTSYNWVIVIKNTGQTAITSVVAGVVLTGNASSSASCTMCASNFKINNQTSSPVGQQSPLTSNERAYSAQLFVPGGVAGVNQSPYPVSITVTYADGTQSTLSATAPLCTTSSCENQSGGATISSGTVSATSTSSSP